jgi:hypothetical protein
MPTRFVLRLLRIAPGEGTVTEDDPRDAQAGDQDRRRR